MKVKYLTKLLEGLDPEIDVTFQVGRDDAYREKCAKVELVDGECLEYLDVDRLVVYPEDNEGNPSFADITLEEYNHFNLNKKAAEFNIIYKSNKKEN